MIADKEPNKPEDYNTAIGDSHGGHVHISALSKAVNAYANAEALAKQDSAKRKRGKNLGTINSSAATGMLEVKDQITQNVAYITQEQFDDLDRLYPEMQPYHNTQESEVSARARMFETLSVTKSDNLRVLLFRAHCLEKALAESIRIIETSADPATRVAATVDKILKIGMGEA